MLIYAEDKPLQIAIAHKAEGWIMREHIETFVLHLDISRAFKLHIANSCRKKNELIDMRSQSGIAMNSPDL